MPFLVQSRQWTGEQRGTTFLNVGHGLYGAKITSLMKKKMMNIPKNLASAMDKTTATTLSTSESVVPINIHLVQKYVNSTFFSISDQNTYTLFQRHRASDHPAIGPSKLCAQLFANNKPARPSGIKSPRPQNAHFRVGVTLKQQINSKLKKILEK